MRILVDNSARAVTTLQQPERERRACEWSRRVTVFLQALASPALPLLHVPPPPPSAAVPVRALHTRPPTASSASHAVASARRPNARYPSAVCRPDGGLAQPPATHRAYRPKAARG